jgi:hypothetical protein
MPRTGIRTALGMTLIAVAAATIVMPGTAAATWSPTPEQREGLRKMQAEYDYPAIVRAYADFMIGFGRDTYGKVRSPLFVSVMDRKTATVFPDMKQLPYPHVITKPYAPGLRRDHKMRPQDRTYSGGNPLEDLPLYGLLHRMSETTGDPRYAIEADKSIAWFLANAQSPATGLYAWGSHMYWDVHKDLPIHASNGSPVSGYGGHEYNYVWPYWEQNPEALRRFAHGLWKNQIADPKSGRFSRHAGYVKRGVEPGYEFPQTGSCYMDVWAREFGRSGDPEMQRAIQTLLKLYRSMRDPKTGAMAWCTAEGADRREVASVEHNLLMATTLQDAAAFVEMRDKDLAGEMRKFASEIDDEYLSNDYDTILDVAGKGILNWYTLADRTCMAKGFTPPPGGVDSSVGYPLKAADGQAAASLFYLAPWFVGRSYASAALLLLDRYQRCAKKHKPLYRRAILETAGLYMTLDPEVQFVLYPDDIAHVVKLLRECHGLTNDAMYLHRADHMMKLGVRLFFDDVSPLPKISNFDDWYESSTKNGSSMEILRQMLELARDLAALTLTDRTTPELRPDNAWVAPDVPVAGNGTGAEFASAFRAAAAAGLAVNWNGEGLNRVSKDLILRYGPEKNRRTLYLSLTSGAFTPEGLRGSSWDIGVSDAINTIPTAAGADKFNGRMSGFTGKGFTEDHIGDAGYKDVARQVAVLIRNDGDVPAVIRVMAVQHDNYHDNGIQSCEKQLGAGGQGLFLLTAQPLKWLRRLEIASGDGNASLRVRQLAIIMAPRDRLAPSPPR